jgi:hypothetical protein
MARNYYNRYELFESDGNFRVVPGINLPIKPTDKYIQYRKGKLRLDKISDEYYSSPLFGWLIMTANPMAGTNEFEIPDKFIIRIPFPLNSSLQDYKKEIETYKRYNG